MFRSLALKYLILNRRYLVLPLILVVTASLLTQFTDINLLIAKNFYSASTHNWLAANSWLANTVLHNWGRNLIAILFAVSLLTFIASYTQLHRLSRCRKAAGYLALCIVLSTALVGLGKKFSNVDCPRSLHQFGGQAPYVHLFSSKPSELPAGHCFPGGHSSGAFSLFALYFIFLFYWPQHAKKILTFVLLLGLTYALTQWARGAHFVIDDIWSAVLAWYISLGLFLLIFTRHREPSRLTDTHD